MLNDNQKNSESAIVVSADLRAIDGGTARRVIWVACIALAVFTLWKYWQAQGTRPNGVDEAVYTYVGWTWHDGYWPYRDTWDRKGPVVYVATFASTTLAGTAPEVTGVQSIALGTAMAVVVAGIAAVLWGGNSSALAFLLGILLLSQQSPESGLGATPGLLTALFSAGAILAAFISVRSANYRRSALLSVVAGISGGLCVCTKPNAISGAVIALTVILLFSRSPRLRERLVLVSFTIFGILIPIVLFAGLFYVAGALNALVDRYVVYNMIYSRYFLPSVGMAGLLQRARISLANVGLFRPFVAILVTATTAAISNIVLRGKLKGSTAKANAAIRYPELIIPLWLLLEFAIFVSNGSWSYHAPPMLPGLALGGTWLVVATPRLSHLPGRSWTVIGRVMSISILIWLVLWPTHAALALQPPRGVARESSEWTNLVDIVTLETPPTGRVFFLTWDAAFIMNITHRVSVSRYEDIEPLVVKGSASDTRWAEYLDEIRTTSPKVMLLSNFGTTPNEDLRTLVHETLTWFATHFVPAGDNTEYPHRKLLEEYIASHYHIVACTEVDRICLLRLNQ